MVIEEISFCSAQKYNNQLVSYCMLYRNTDVMRLTETSRTRNLMKMTSIENTNIPNHIGVL